MDEINEGKSARGRSITRGIASLTIQNLGTSILGFVFLAVLLRLLPQVQYGVYSAVAISVTIGTSVAGMGLQIASTRYLSLLIGRNAAQRELWIEAKRMALLSILFSGASALVYILLSNFLSIYFTRSTLWSPVFFLGGLWLFSSTLGSVLDGCIQGMKKYTLLATMLFVSRVAMVALTIVGLLAEKNVIIPILAWIIYCSMISAWASIVLIKDLLNKSRIIEPKSRAIEKESFGVRDLLKYSVPLGVASILAIVTSNGDLVIVGGFLPTSTLGVYNTAVTISSVLSLVLITPLTTALLPEAASSSHNNFEVSNGLRLALRFTMLTLLPVSFLVAAMSRQLILLFSGSTAYLDGSGALEIISIFYVFLAIQMVVYAMLQALGQTIPILVISAITALVDVGAAIILVPSFGVTGASIARALTGIVGMIAALYVSRHFSRGLNNLGFYLRATVSAIVPFTLVWSLSNFVSSRPVTVIPYSIAGVVVLFICLRALRVLSSEELELIGNSLPSRARKVLSILAR